MRPIYLVLIENRVAVRVNIIHVYYIRAHGNFNREKASLPLIIFKLAKSKRQAIKMKRRRAREREN